MREHVSGWATPFVDEESGEVLSEPRNVTPGRHPKQASPLLAMALAQHDAARVRMKTERKKAWENTARALLAFVISIAPVPHWAGVLFFWVTVVFGYLTLRNFYEYRCARIQSMLWPD